MKKTPIIITRSITVGKPQEAAALIITLMEGLYPMDRPKVLKAVAAFYNSQVIDVSEV